MCPPQEPRHIQVVKLCLDPTFVQASLLLNYTTGLNAEHNTLLYTNQQTGPCRGGSVAGVPRGARA